MSHVEKGERRRSYDLRGLHCYLEPGVSQVEKGEHRRSHELRKLKKAEHRCCYELRKLKKGNTGVPMS